MSENTQNPSAVDIVEAKITSYDGSKTEDITTGFIGAFELTQSMHMVSYEGKITVLDYRGILEQFPEIDLEKNKFGIFSKASSADTELREKDRVEIYRPLIADPKESRRKRAEKKAHAHEHEEENKA